MAHVPRVFIASRIGPGPLSIEGDPARHLTTVLRARPGDEVLLFSGDGREWLAQIRAVEKTTVAVEVGELTRIEPPSPIVLEAWVALVRANRFDWMVEKCAEAGADIIRPILTEYTQQSDASTSKVDRWRRIVVEAGEQCGRLFVPVVEAPMPLAKAMHSFGGALVYGDPEGPPIAKARHLIPSSGHVALVVGPEGGLSRADESLLSTRGAVGINLSPHLLRTETAAIAGVVLLRALMG
jgi:16S rRNA (uracil1498-N3)-methyltransferase